MTRMEDQMKTRIVPSGEIAKKGSLLAMDYIPVAQLKELDRKIAALEKRLASGRKRLDDLKAQRAVVAWVIEQDPNNQPC